VGQQNEQHTDMGQGVKVYYDLIMNLLNKIKALSKALYTESPCHFLCVCHLLTIIQLWPLSTLLIKV